MSSAQAPLVGRNCWRKASAMFRVRQTPHAWLVYFGPGASTNRMMCDAWVVRARALRAAADAAPTRATRFLKPVLGVEVRSVA